MANSYPFTDLLGWIFSCKRLDIPCKMLRRLNIKPESFNVVGRLPVKAYLVHPALPDTPASC
jgi:hypothetical protein